jgi:hypothetical protein
MAERLDAQSGAAQPLATSSGRNPTPHAAQVGVLGLVDDTHPAAAELLDDAVRDGLADQFDGDSNSQEAVLGANDGILSTSSLVLGVAAAQATHSNVLVAGVAGLMAGSMSMAAGEYVSVHCRCRSQTEYSH